MKWKLQMEPDKVYEMVISSVTRARNHTDDVEWSCEDGTRTEHDFLCRCVEAAIKAGATTINIPDTVGYTVPEEYFRLIKMVRERVPNAAQLKELRIKNYPVRLTRNGPQSIPSEVVKTVPMAQASSP